VIDGNVPTVSSVTSTKADAAYAVGATIPITITFNQTVNVTGTPQLTLETGGSDGEDPTRRWIVDPLDGTTNFVHGYPSFAVSIGLFYKNEPLVAVVVEMPHTKLYSAVKSEGAWCEGQSISCSQTESLNQSLLVTGFGYEHGENWKRNMRLFKHFTDTTHGVRRLGAAAVDLCHVASGKVDGFWEYDLKPWDTAASILIAREAGCVVSKMDGSDYSIYDNNIMVGNPKIHSRLIREIGNII
jgi:myo-inositol-1(or 4)-monophosphatase